MARPSPEDMKRRYEAAKALRSIYEPDWRMAAAYCRPRNFNAWTANGPPGTQGTQTAARRYAYDNTGVRALPKYVSILSRLATPHSQRWHKLSPSDPNLLKSRSVREYFEAVTDLMFKVRYDARAKFEQAVGEMYSSMGVYGTGPMFIGQRRKTPADRTGGLLYLSVPLRDVFLLLDDEGNVDTVFRRFYLTARQFTQKFSADAAPRCVRNELQKSTPDDAKYFEFVHIVHPRDDYDPQSIRVNRHPFVGYYLSIDSVEYVGDEEGFSSIPYKTPRTETEAGEAYGYSPAIQALPALGSVSAIKKTLLKQGQKAVDPVLLAHDDGVMNGGMNLTPGAVNYGGIDGQGRKLVQALEVGNFNVGENILADERRDIEDSFFVTLFQILTETPEMTATEVIERVAEKASLLAPTMGRIQSEFLGPCIEREFDILAEMGRLNGIEMPGELIEAQGEYSIVYTSPLAKGQYAEEVSGFMRSVEMAMQVAQATGDPSKLDAFDFDTAIPEIADRLSSPARWMNDAKKIAALRQAREAQAQQAQLMQNAPALASAAKTASEMGMGGPQQ